MFRYVVAAFLLASCGAAGGAELNPETDKPYSLQVVLQIAEHRIFTEPFREQVRRELQDSLQAALGNLARVEVGTKHLRLAEIEAKGLQRALDGWHFLSDEKIHFVRIGFANGRYEIEARQYDGFTGLPSPVVRRETVEERLLVARNAALLIHHDFGLAGTVVKVEGDKVNVAMKGAGLGVSLAPFLKKGDVFAIAQISRTGAGLRSSRELGSLLQVTDDAQDGHCRCQLWHRWEHPLASGPGVQGYRCLKLGTTKAKVRLRLVDKRGAPVSSKQVRISPDGFQGTPADQGSSKPDGLFESQQLYQNVACVRILDSQQLLANVPLEIVDDRTQSIVLNVSPAAERRGPLYLRRDRWLHRVFDTMEVAGNVVREFNTAQSRSDAQKKAQEGLNTLEHDLNNLNEEHENLKREFAQLPPESRPSLAEGEQHLQELQALRQQLEGHVASLDKVVKDETDPKRLKWQKMVVQARALQDSADYGQAIKLYEEVVAESNDDNVRKELDKLKEAWKVKNQQHEQAREFIYKTWSQLTKVSELKDNLSKAQKAFKTCQAVGDKLSPRMLLKANLAHATRLAREVETFRPQENEDERKLVDKIYALVKDLEELSKEIESYLGKGKSDKKPPASSNAASQETSP
jgi:hypothetical protein